LSIFREVPLECPDCGSQQVETIAVSLSGPRAPEVTATVRDGSFHRFTCPDCATEYYADGPLVYTDFERKHWICEFPRDWETSWAVLESQSLDSFRRAMIDFAPPFLRAECAGFTVRTVFGLEALAEKIAILHADLDDRLIEVVKLAVLLRTGGPLHPGARPRFDRRDHLGVHLVVSCGGDRDAVFVPTEAVDEINRDPAWASVVRELVGAQYVDLGRVMLDGRGRLPEAAYA
jgi:hypothetical protein